MAAQQPPPSPANMSQFPDSHELLSALQAMPVASLRETIRDCNTTPGVKMLLSGSKSEQLQKLTNLLFEAVNTSNSLKYNLLRHHIHRHAKPESFLRSPNYQLWLNSTNGGSLSYELGKRPDGKTYYLGTESGTTTPGGNAAAGPSNHQGWKPPERIIKPIPGRFGNGYPPPGLPPKPASQATPGRVPSAVISGGPPTFQSSPFYTVKEFIGRPITLLENYGTEKKTMMLGVVLTAAQVALLQDNSNGISYKVLLFCGKQILVNSSCTNQRSPATVEFPSTCEVKVNGQMLSVNLKGTKKSSAKVSPPDLNKDKKFTSMTGVMNKVEIVYTNASTKYAVYAALCSVTEPEVLAKRVRSGRFRTKEDVLAGKKKAAEDDEIQAGSSTLSLRCPLTYMRMKSPCRSASCNHTQCFDAESFFMMMQQTPTWICPVCNNVLNPEALILDGYVDEILSKVPDGQDNVIVEPDGSWHTSDGKRTSDGKPLASKSNEQTHEIIDSDDEEIKPSLKSISKGKERETPNNASESSTPKNRDVVVLDGSSPIRRNSSFTSSSKPSSSSNATFTGARTPTTSAEVIDLTLDSDDDEPAPRPEKRSRTENNTSSTSTPNGSFFSSANGNGSGSGTSGAGSSTQTNGAQATNGFWNADEVNAARDRIHRIWNGTGTSDGNGNLNADGDGNSGPLVVVHGRVVNIDTHPSLKGWTRKELLDHNHELLKTLIHNHQNDP